MLTTVLPPTTISSGNYPERMEGVISLTHKDAPSSLDTKPFYIIQRLAMCNPITASKNRISEIANLNYNWDGYGGIAPFREVINNSYRFIDTLHKNGITDIDSEDIYPMPYGSVVIEIYNHDDMVSIEIGQHQIGFFTDYREKENILLESEETDFRSLPESLQKALDILRYGG